MTRRRDGRAWRLANAEDVSWINEGTAEIAGNGISIAIPPIYEAYWTVDVPGSADRGHDAEEALQLDTALIDLLAAFTSPQPWWISFLDRSGRPGTHLGFPGAPRVALLETELVVVEAGPEQALGWRNAGEWLHGALPDVMFPQDRTWLSVTLWDDHWLCMGGSFALQRAVLEHPLLASYAYAVNVDDLDATPPGHDVWWHH